MPTHEAIWTAGIEDDNFSARTHDTMQGVVRHVCNLILPDVIIFIPVYKALRSAARYARSQGRTWNILRMKRTERSTILGANWRLASAKSSMLQDNNPDAAHMYEIHRKNGEKEQQCCILLRSKLKASPTPALCIEYEYHNSRVLVYFCSVDR